MNLTPKISRRSFIIGSAAVGSGLALGLRLPPFGPAVVRAADGSPEITVWVVIRPDNTTAIRVVRAEMGQGTIMAWPSRRRGARRRLEESGHRVSDPGESVARKRGVSSRPAAAASASRTSTCVKAARPPA
jgi:isoquinoline 1-oxidoreductase beta subunit